MKVIIAGGGTAGHINPAIAIANELKKKYPKVKILYIGSKKGMESKIVPNEGFDFESIEVSGFCRGFKPYMIKHNIKAVATFFKGNNQAKKIIKRFKPDLVIGTGGYISGPVLLQGVKYGAKTIIHEQNAFPGITTKALAKKVDVVLSAFEEARTRLDVKGEFHVVGNPVRESFIFSDKAAARKKLSIPLDATVLLSSGGSLGARTINHAVANLIAWHSKENKIYHIHSKGRNGEDFDEVLNKLNVDLTGNKKITVNEYINNMGDCFAAADLIISRAGAISIAEIECSGKASILIPSPNVTENHQYFNALVLAKKHAAILIEEKDLTGEMLIKKVDELINNKQKLTEYGKSAQKLAIINSAEQIVKIIDNFIKTA